MTNTHKIVYEWEKMPYLVEDAMPLRLRVSIRMRQFLQKKVFNSVTHSIMASHGNKIRKEDRDKVSFELFIEGTEEECLKHLKDLHNLKKADLDAAVEMIPANIRVKVAKEDTRFQKVTDQLLGLNIILEVRMVEL